MSTRSDAAAEGRVREGERQRSRLWEGGASCLPQPSIPKSSVNFFTLRRSSVLTVGRVVERERSMSA